MRLSLLRYFRHRWPDVRCRVSRSSQVVALTIDGGSSGNMIEFVDILHDNLATATFLGHKSTDFQEETSSGYPYKGNELGDDAMHGSLRSPRALPTLPDPIRETDHTASNMLQLRSNLTSIVDQTPASPMRDTPDAAQLGLSTGPRG